MDKPLSDHGPLSLTVVTGGVDMNDTGDPIKISHDLRFVEHPDTEGTGSGTDPVLSVRPAPIFDGNGRTSPQLK